MEDMESKASPATTIVKEYVHHGSFAEVQEEQSCQIIGSFRHKFLGEVNF